MTWGASTPLLPGRASRQPGQQHQSPPRLGNGLILWKWPCSEKGGLSKALESGGCSVGLMPALPSPLAGLVLGEGRKAVEVMETEEGADELHPFMQPVWYKVATVALPLVWLWSVCSYMPRVWHADV